MLQSCPRALQGVERVVSGPEGRARISEEQTGRSEGWNLDQGPGQDAAAAQGERGAVANMPVQASGDSFAALVHSDWGASTEIHRRVYDSSPRSGPPSCRAADGRFQRPRENVGLKYMYREATQTGWVNTK